MGLRPCECSFGNPRTANSWQNVSDFSMADPSHTCWNAGTCSGASLETAIAVRDPCLPKRWCENVCAQVERATKWRQKTSQGKLADQNIHKCWGTCLVFLLRCSFSFLSSLIFLLSLVSSPASMWLGSLSLSSPSSPSLSQPALNWFVNFCCVCCHACHATFCSWTGQRRCTCLSQML